MLDCDRITNRSALAKMKIPRGRRDGTPTVEYAGMNINDNKRKLHLDPNLHVVFAVTLTAIMGVSSLTPAFPRIATELGVSAKQVGYLITYFTFPGVILAPIMGVLADRLGRKRILVPSLLLFAIAGTACSLVRDFDLLLGLRFFQGIGAAALGALNMTIVGDLYAGKERTTALGYNASVLSIGTAAYPLIGGALATIGWYCPFLLPAVAFPVALLVIRRLKSPEPKNKQRLRTYFGHVWDIVRRRSIVGLFICGLLAFVVLYGAYLTYLPFLVASSFRGTPFEIGLILSATSVSTALTASQLGRFARRFPEKWLLAAGCLIYALGLAAVPFVRHLWLLFIPSLVYGIAAALAMPSITSLIAAFAPMSQRAAIMSLNGMILRLGQTLGPVIMAAVYGLWGLNGVYFVGSFLALGMFGIAAIIIQQPGDGPQPRAASSGGSV
jgi:ACDE family multidrug resistance protein